MINTRSLLVSLPWAVLSAVSLICAQDVRPSEAGVTIQRPLLIQELPLQPQRFLAASFLADPALPPSAASTPSTNVPDLSEYREFQLGMSLPNVAELADLKPSEARVVHQRPAVIQELEWLPQSSLASSPQDHAIEEVVFSFYNGELFRLVVSYDSYKTEGMTDEDMVEAISAKYGTATRPASKIALSSSLADEGSGEIIARWEDSQYSLNLFRSTYPRVFRVLMFSKRLDTLALTAAAEADRMDEQDAPQREIELQKLQDEADHTALAKARLVNKAAFRP